MRILISLFLLIYFTLSMPEVSQVKFILSTEVSMLYFISKPFQYSPVLMDITPNLCPFLSFYCIDDKESMYNNFY
ncbi:hypothetical protein BDB01DRAFT_2412 [Pilobolus umbonatus]|nr:hypothetical protein BDB01DRAFT_2412 [Pilobolus umbonatus]